MKNKLAIGSRFFFGRRKTAIWSVCTACNCKCKMCSMWMKRPEFISFEKAEQILKKLKREKFFLVSLTGGEPFLHPRIFDIIKAAKKHGFIVHIPTNGTLLTKETAEKLKESGLDVLSMSLDTSNKETHDKIRGYESCFEKAVKGIKKCREAGLSVCASTVINIYNYKEIENHIKFVTKDLGIPIIICFPETTANKEYFMDKADVLDIQKSELEKTLQEIIKMKKTGYKIINTFSFLNDAARFLSGKKPEYRCLAGKEVFFIDWNGSIKPCFNRKETFSLKEKWNLKNPNCNECFIECFREPSIIAQLGPFRMFIERSSLKMI